MDDHQKKADSAILQRKLERHAAWLDLIIPFHMEDHTSGEAPGERLLSCIRLQREADECLTRGRELDEK